MATTDPIVKPLKAETYTAVRAIIIERLAPVALTDGDKWDRANAIMTHLELAGYLKDKEE